jgi:hypothetical protein
MTRPSTKHLQKPKNPTPVSTHIAQVEHYEDKMTRNPEWAMGEGSLFFEGKGEVQATLRKVTSKLRELGIDYAVVGGMALFKYGYRRFTEDVDLLVTRDGLKEIHRKLDGLGFLPPFDGSKNLRDTDNGVKIEFLVTGEFPVDGKPKPVAFPNPGDVADDIEGIRYVKIGALIEMKIASGMTNPDRRKDLVDVMEIIKVLDLPLSFSDDLNPYVQKAYQELWKDSRPTAKRYITLWRNKFLTVEATSLEDMIKSLQAAAATLQAMLADGVTLDPEGGTDDDYAHLVTTDPAIAKKYDMHDEKEFLGVEDDDGVGDED